MGDEEKHMGIPVSPLCDRMTVNVPQSQVAFSQFIVQPSFEYLCGLLPKIRTSIMPTIEQNAGIWQQRESEANTEGIWYMLLKSTEPGESAERNSSPLAHIKSASGTPNYKISLLTLCGTSASRMAKFAAKPFCY